MTMQAIPMQAPKTASGTRRRVFRPNARILRFALTGGLAALLQIALLRFFVEFGWHALLANAVAFLLAAQFNFLLSRTFTWRDRRQSQTLARCWLAFHGSIAGMAVINMIVFAAVRTAAPDTVASVAGICTAALGNFFLGDRLIFRTRPASKLEQQRTQPIASAA